MKLIIFAGTPGSGKTSIIKHVVAELNGGSSLFFAKFDCLKTEDHQLIAKKFKIPAESKLAGELCPDHYMALEMPKLIKENPNRDLILETAGLCLRCSPYIKKSLGVCVLDITSGSPERYGPILTDADIVAVSKGDLISQAEREIFRANILKVNPRAKIVEANGLTGEGAIDLARYIRETKDIDQNQELVLRHSMPSAICGFCYGNRSINEDAVLERDQKGKELKALMPSINCGICGYKSCNEFIRAVLDKKVKEAECPFVQKTTADKKEDPKLTLIRHEFEKYAKKRGGMQLNLDRRISDALLGALLREEKKTGERLCSCKRIPCPCDESQEEVKKQGHCHCSLFVK